MRTFVKGFGCSSNIADTEVLTGCLMKAGHSIVSSPGQAELIIYNTCAVKAQTEDRMIHLLKTVPERTKLIVAGCLPLVNAERLRREVRFDGVVGPACAEAIVDIVEQVSAGEQVEAIENAAPLRRLDLPRKRVNSHISIIPICYGCLGACAYCCVRLARGSLRSHGIEEIVVQVRADLAQGIRELWFTSQDTASYGRDLGCTLSELLERVCKIDGDFLLRVGMMTPDHLLEIKESIMAAFRDAKVFKFLHLPVQSGADAILSKMNRGYTGAAFLRLVAEFRVAFPQSTLATDVIVGFPGETQEDFDRTVELVEMVRPDIVNVSRFFARPGTAAMNFKPRISAQEVKARSRRLARVVGRVALARNHEWIGWRGRMLVDEIGRPGSVVGRNFAYKPIVLKCGDRSARQLLGQYVNVEVVGASRSHLVGEVR
jgi:threonylcarbamoyladenosine tRNA methylthiotransferase CDKAL1